MAEEKTTGYGSTKSYGKQQSLLSPPPTSVTKVKTPEVVETSSAGIVNDTYRGSQIVIYVFGAFFIAAMAATLLGALGAVDRWILFFCIITGTIVLSLVGAYGMYFKYILNC